MFLFVYGTLLNGMERFMALNGCSFIGSGVINGVMFDLGSYPGISNGNNSIFGEVYKIDDEILKQLDRIEGYTPGDEKYSLYLRRTEKVTLLSEGTSLTAYTYFYNSFDNRKIIESGDYRRYRMEKSSDYSWYLAYGSNMNSERLKSRIGEVNEIKTGWIDGYKLIFNKRAENGGVYANIAYVGPGFMCPVAAYLITFSQFSKLDNFEGSPRHYMRISMPFRDMSEHQSIGQVYVGNPGKLTSESVPSHDYFQHIYKGYEEHGFDTGLLPGFYQ